MTDSLGTTTGLASFRKKEAEDAVEKVKELDYTDALNMLRKSFKSGRTKKIDWRRAQLKQLRKMIVDNVDDIATAISQDLGRSKQMCVMGDLNTTIHSCDEALAHLDDWTSRRPVSLQLELLGSKGYRLPEPKGVCLNISPWNFPVELLVSPMASMIAAGNCVVVKPSEICVNVSNKMAELIPKYLDMECVHVVMGGVAETTALLKQQFDHILYTGNGYVGRIVMTAAAKHLCPVTLELGGKSPVIIDDTADIKMAAKRIMMAKAFNCGQICVAPDYVLIQKSVEAAFYKECEAALKEFYPEGQENSKSYGRIINHNHFKRIKSLLDDHGGEVILGGAEKADEASKLFPTTIVKSPSINSKLMSEEIFGPLLPVIAVESVKEACEFVSDRSHPLALYVFSKNSKTVKYTLANTHSGGACVNDCVFQVVADNLPFGGVGGSGMGITHGKEGFDEFSHLRSVLDRGNNQVDVLALLRYAPYSESGYKQVKFLACNTGPIMAIIGKVLSVVKYSVPVVASVVAAKFCGYL